MELTAECSRFHLKRGKFGEAAKNAIGWPSSVMPDMPPNPFRRFKYDFMISSFSHCQLHVLLLE